MPEKTEWEIVDTPVPGARPDREHVLQALLGQHWKLKAAAIAVAAIAVLVLVVMLAGVVMLVMAGVMVLSIGIAKLQRLLRHGHHGKSG